MMALENIWAKPKKQKSKKSFDNGPNMIRLTALESSVK